MQEPIRVTVWNENRHEQKNPEIAKIYPKGIHGAIAGYLEKNGFAAATATLDEPDHGLTDEVIDSTDVLIWWGHVAHGEVADEIVAKLHQRILSGMGLIALHSAHYSKIFRRLMGTNCSLKYREAAERERLWNIAPNHEITKGIGDTIMLEQTEMYGERFDIPEPDKLIFISWFKGGEVFRSGCVWERGNGRIFYFKPGHESHPIYYNEQVLKVIANAARWAYTGTELPTNKATAVREPLEEL